MLQIAVCDDERAAADLIAGLARDWARGRGVEARVDTFASADALTFSLDDGAPDVALLDIEVPGASGMELARLLRERGDVPGAVLSGAGWGVAAAWLVATIACKGDSHFCTARSVGVARRKPWARAAPAPSFAAEVGPPLQYTGLRPAPGEGSSCSRSLLTYRFRLNRGEP